jgi:ethanolamine utilization protein EutQ (cupin superfamily)
MDGVWVAVGETGKREEGLINQQVRQVIRRKQSTWVQDVGRRIRLELGKGDPRWGKGDAG